MPVRNVCDCHNPPGGSVVCEPHQMALCIVINGVARRECLDPPPTADAAGLVNWALSHITGRRLALGATVDDSVLHLLREGRLELSNDAIATFALPERITAAIRDLTSESDRGEMGTASV